MTDIIQMWKDELSPSVEDRITTSDPTFTLAGCTVKFQMRLEGGTTLKVDAVATIVSAPTCQVQYDWVANDVNTVGRYQAWWQVTLPNTKKQSTPEFPIVIQSHDGTVSQVTIETIRNSVETGINDQALQLILDDAIAHVEGRFGTDAEKTTRFQPAGQFIRLNRPALSITAVSEFNELRYPLYTLTTADYELHPGGRVLQRLSGGFVIYANRFWAPIVDVTYVPKPEQTIRDRVIVDLVKLGTQYSALEQENVGGRTGYINMQLPYLRERERLLSAIPNSRGFHFA